MNNNEELMNLLSSNCIEKQDSEHFNAFFVSNSQFLLYPQDDPKTVVLVAIGKNSVELSDDVYRKIKSGLIALATKKVENKQFDIFKNQIVVDSETLGKFSETINKEENFANFTLSKSAGEILNSYQKKEAVELSQTPVIAPEMNNPEPVVAATEVSQQPVELVSEQPQPVQEIAPTVQPEAPEVAMPESVSQGQVPAQGVAPMVQPENPVKGNNGPVLVKTPNTTRRAGFVKYPVFILTLMAIGAFGIFIGKLLFTYLNQS